MLKMFFALVLTCGSDSALASDQLTERPPNVVLIFADDLGYGDIGCYGATKVRTPHIDSLATAGRRFTDVHSASAVCTPSRYGLLTGQYPVRAMNGKGVWGPLPIDSGLIVHPETLTLGKMFRNKGYSTACFGKWHLGFKNGANDWQVPLRPGPQDVGFDHYFGLGVVNSAPPYVYINDESFLGYDAADPLVYKGKPVTPTVTFPKEASVKSPNRFSGAIAAHKIYDDEKTGTLLTEKAVNWIGENKDKPFFLYFPTPNIHHPCTPAAQFKGTSECGLYGDFVHELDSMVGQILKSLDENGLSDNTLVIFTSDNGGMMNLAGRNAAAAGHKMNGDLLGFKFGIWEGGHRVPFIARWPEKIRAGTTSDQLVGLVDMLATFTAVTGQDQELVKDTDSINMLPALLEDPVEPLRTELLLAAHSKKHLALRRGKWMYIAARGSGGFRGSKPHQHAWGGPPATALVGSVNSDIENGKLKKDAPKGQLYDLKNDPNQTRNVYRDYPDVVIELDASLNSFRPKRVSNPKKNEQPSKKKAKKSLTATGPTSGEKKPNFVVIFTDDQGYQDLGCYGSPDIKTPRLDQMANEGMRFTNFYAQTVCGPSRAALMTGCYPVRVARHADPNSIHPELHLEEITIAEVLKEQGYATAAIGKWDLAGHNPAKYKRHLLPTHQGFDEFFGTSGSNDKSVNLIRGDEKVEAKADMSQLTRRYTDEAIGFMERKKDVPFFLYLAHTMPHTKLAASKEFKGKSKAGLYGDVVEELDHHVGRVLDSVRELGIDDNTYVIFTSDNGPWLIRKQHGGHADPLRSGKTSFWEGGFRVPCIVRAPGKVPAGAACDAVTATIDLLPTLAKLAGGASPGDRVIDGVDIGKIVHGETAELDRNFFFYQHNCLRAVRSGKWKLILPHTEPVTGSISTRWNRHVDKADAIRLKETQLYDLDADIGETVDVAKQNPQAVAELTKLATWAKNDIGDYDLFGRNARTFGSPPRTLSSTAASTDVFPGEKTNFQGFDRYTFKTEDASVSIVCPQAAASGKPWLWRSMFWGGTKGATKRVTLMDLQLVKQGYHVVICPGDVSGHARGNVAIDAAYNLLTEKHGFCKKVSMGSMSRETLSLFRWASANPEKIASIYVDNGVCNVKSWPGGKPVQGSASNGKGAPKSWELLKTTYGFETNAQALAAQVSPIDWLEPLAKEGVPILMASGTRDLVVPYEENAAIVKERYENLGGSVRVILEDKGHHPHGLKDPSPVIEFIIENTPGGK